MPPAGLVVTTDVARMDLDRVHRWLSEESYWARGRSRAVFDRSLEGSTAYAVLGPGNDGQLAFARVVGDGATYAWLCDVFVDAKARGRGIGSWLLERVVSDLTAAGIPRIILATRDAHEVYRRLGFRELGAPGQWMEIDRRNG
jgi:GNAT superfamily N-acetyltransferase